MYEVATEIKCKLDLFKDNSPTDGSAYWSRRECTQGIWLGWTVEGCCDGKFRRAHSLLL